MFFSLHMPYMPIHAYTHLYIHIHAYAHIHPYIHLYIHMPMHAYTYLYMCIHTHTYTYLYIPMLQFNLPGRQSRKLRTITRPASMAHDIS